MEVKTLNPYGLQEGQVCDLIRIYHSPQDAPEEEVVVALPTEEDGSNLQDQATEAYLYAKQEGQLTASMMVVCGFSYHDGEQDAWIAFDPADY